MEEGKTAISKLKGPVEGQRPGVTTESTVSPFLEGLYWKVSEACAVTEATREEHLRAMAKTRSPQEKVQGKTSSFPFLFYPSYKPIDWSTDIRGGIPCLSFQPAHQLSIDSLRTLLF